MQTGWRLIKRYVLFLIALIVLFPSLPYAAAPNNYCQIPPFVVGRVKPNLLLMIDNSASQFDLAYIAGSTTPPTTYSCNGGVTTQTSFCYDNTYSNSYTYVGYFDPASIYYYNTIYPATDSNGATFPFLPSSDIFITPPPSSMPASCNYGGSSSATPYVCINTSGSNVTGFYATGNYLNWLSASKFDQQKQALTGGKYDTTNSLLGGESRGCVGGRFIKADPNLSGITFAIRGPIEPNVITNTNTRGGMTRIEIYLGTISANTMQSCQCAVAEWTSGNYGQAQTDTRSCLNLGNNEISAFNQILQDCWKIKQNIAGGATVCGSGHGQIFDGVSINSDETQCTGVYNDVCGSNGNLSGNHCTNTGTDPGSWIANAGTLISSTGGAWQCTNQATHLAPTPPYDACGTDTAGFLGNCATFGVSHGQLSVTWTDACVQREVLHYCFGVQVAAVIDPSEGAAVSGTTGNIPSVLMNSLVNQFGPPAGTFFVQVKTSNKYCSVATTTSCTTDSDCNLLLPSGQTCGPVGVIQEFSNSIRFGAMKFNLTGSASECNQTGTNIECPTSGSNLDGAQIISPSYCSVHTSTSCDISSDCPSGETCVSSGYAAYIKSNCSVTTSTSCEIDSPDCPSGETCISPVGNHSSGLIKAIDNVVAKTWTPFAEAFYDAIGYYSQRTDLRLNTADFDTTQPSPKLTLCRQNNVLFVTDGMSTADLNSTVNTFASNHNDGDGQINTSMPGTCSDGTTIPFGGSRNLDDLAWLAQNKNINDFTALITGASQTIATHVIFTGAATSLPGECNPATLMSETAKNGGGLYQQVTTPQALQSSLRSVFQFISNKASSGTAASVLASGQGQGANLVQAVYYPRTLPIASGGIFSTEIQWAGRLQNLWYNIDPFFANSNIYDDYSGGSPDRKLNLTNDRTVTTCFVASPNTVTISGNTYTNVTVATLNNTNCASPYTGAVLLENIVNLWEAGVMLWNRNLSTSPRTIYTTVDGSSLLSGNFTTANATNSTLQSLLQATGSTAAAEATSIIRWVNGEDTVPGSGNFATNPVAGFTPVYRQRTVALDLNSDGNTTDTAVSLYGLSINESAKVWKLGDIIDSTPRMSSWLQLNTYDTKYNDASYTTYLNSSNYTSRGMVFAGANDGMLHAFSLGTLVYHGGAGCTGANETACLTGSNLGNEAWAFIPKNALPYLRYMADPSYCHVYSVDLSPYIFDASIGAPGSGDISGSATKSTDGTVWRTVLIGGMRYGGACRNNGTACNSKSCSVTTGTTCSLDSDCPAGETCLSNCVNTPAAGSGYSSYFALDITNQNSPQLLWEFSDPALGFATSGPAIVREGSSSNNGKWFVVLGSGPTGPIDTTNNQFLGRSDQNLKIFVLNLKGPSSGTWTLNTDYWVKDTGISNAFAGSMFNSTIDTDLNYQDNVVYIPYIRKDTSTSTWTQGGVGRLLTMDQSLTPPQETSVVSNWTFSQVIDAIGSVTSAIAPLQNTNKGILWLYFGTGRFFYEQGATVDDPGSQRTLYGIKEPCFSSAGFAATCTAVTGALTDVTSIGSVPNETTANDPSFKGWYISLNASGNPSGLYAERDITDPLSTTGGNVFFTTYQPYTNVCSFGGKSYIWAVRYNTGGAPSAAQMQGVAMIQVSTGSIQQENLSTAFTDAGGRKTTAIEGVPPTAQGLSVLSSPLPVKRMIHMRER